MRLPMGLGRKSVHLGLAISGDRSKRIALRVGLYKTSSDSLISRSKTSGVSTLNLSGRSKALGRHYGRKPLNIAMRIA